MFACDWRLAGASARGTSHLRNGAPCQDAFQYQMGLQGALVVAVADGAGSAPRALDGAQMATASAAASLMNYCLTGLDQEEDNWLPVMRAAFGEAIENMADYASREQTPLRAFATTLSCAVALDTLLIVGQIGDGITVVECADGSLRSALRPRRGEYANETYFLTMPDSLDYLDIGICHQPIQSLAMMTDGLLRLAMSLPDYEPSDRFFRPLLQFVAETEDESRAKEQLASFLLSERVCARTDDDKTLVLATRLPRDADGKLQIDAQGS